MNTKASNGDGDNDAARDDVVARDDKPGTGIGGDGIGPNPVDGGGDEIGESRYEPDPSRL